MYSKNYFIFKSVSFLLPIIVSLTACTTEKKHQPDFPNIVLIMADDLGYGDLGCYGNVEANTPNLDQLASEGIRFTDYHSNSSVCAPTRAALMTGRYQQRAGVYSVYNGRLKRSEKTIAQRLKEAGYSTGIFGKWHLTGHARTEQEFQNYNNNGPTTWGFDEYVGIMGGMIDAVSHYNEWGHLDWWHGNQLVKEEGYSTHLLTKYATEFIRKNHNKPFFAYVPLTDIHFPWMTPEDPPYYMEGIDNPGSAFPERKRGGRWQGSDTLKRVVQRMIFEVDKSVGTIVNTLKELNIQDNTMVIFISDNGGYPSYLGVSNGMISDMGHYRGGKHNLYEGGHRVPAIAWQPGSISSGVISDATIMSFDWFPTFLELVGLSTPNVEGENGLDGISLLSHLYHQTPVQNRTLFWDDLNWWAVRNGNWKMVVQRKRSNAELYNLALDPSETQDLAQIFPGKVKTMVESLAEWERDVKTLNPIPITHRDKLIE